MYEYSREAFCTYLESTLIPDLISSERFHMASDLSAALLFIRGAETIQMEAGDVCNVINTEDRKDRKRISVQQYHDENDPHNITVIPSGYKDRMIVVIEDPADLDVSCVDDETLQTILKEHGH